LGEPTQETRSPFVWSVWELPRSCCAPHGLRGFAVHTIPERLGRGDDVPLLSCGRLWAAVGGRHSLRRMLEKSVGECYFVTLMVADAPQASDLDDDVEFFDTRLSYLSVSRHGHAKSAAVRACLHVPPCAHPALP